MRCRYLLANVKFNDTYKDSCYFPTIAARDAALIGGNLFSQDDINFNYGSILSTSCVINEYEQENYIIIKNSENKKYFYFIDSVEYLSSNQWRLYLKMDVINQYMVGDAYKNIPPCLVERAHVNRWATNGNRINFNVSNDSEIIVPEFNFDYITEKRNKVKIHYCNNTRVNEWLNNNVACWRIFYIDAKHMFKFYQYGSKSLDDSQLSSQYDNNFAKSYMNVDGNAVNDEYVTFCEPVYRHGASEIYFSNVHWGFRGRWSGCDNFRNHNEGNFIYNIKYVYTCPLDIEQLLGETPLFSNKLILTVPDDNVLSYEVDENVQVRGFRFSGNIKFLFTEGMQNIPGDETFAYFKGVIGGFGSSNKRLENVKIDVQFEFTKSEVVGAKRQNRFEPKRLLDCKRITLRDSANGEYSYRLLYCATNSIPLKYTEMNNITNNNYYFRVANTGIIPVADETNWHGVVNTTDYSQQIVNDAYESFIANNKNFQTIRGIGYLTSLTQAAVSGSLAGVGNTLLNFGLDELKLDNIKNAPNSLRNTNDTFLMNFNVNSGLNLYVDFESCREVEENKYINYLYGYGYKINKIDWVSKYINTRKYFNYIKCNIDSINMEIPNQCEMEIKRIFSQGVRLWNNYDEMYNYEMENYEKMLEN